MRKILILLLFFWVLAPCEAASSKVGTSAAPFLKIGAGARPTAMGEAFVGIADDVNSVYYNPAGISYISHPELMAMHTQWIEGINYDFGAFAYPTDFGAFAVSAFTLKVDDLAKRGLDETSQGEFTSFDSAYAVSYAHNIAPMLSMGVTGRFIQQEIDSSKASTWSGDVGWVYRSSHKPLTLGLAVRHMGPELKFNEESDPLPLTYDIGLGYSFFNDKLKCGLNVMKSRDSSAVFGLGGEYLRPVTSDVHAAFRLGYNNRQQDSSDASGLSLGAGLGFRRFQFDFAWVPMGDLGNTFRYSALLKF